MLQAYKILSYQSIYDALITTDVSLDNIVIILSASGLDLDSELTGEEIIYSDEQIAKPKGGQVSTYTAPTTSTYLTNSTQNIYDVCLMTVGDLDKLVMLISFNSIFNNINDSPDGVKEVNYNNSDITDSGFKLALRKMGINITTGNIEEDPIAVGYLTQENGFYLLQENGYKIIL